MVGESLSLLTSISVLAVRLQSTPQANGGWITTQLNQVVSLTCLLDTADPEKELEWFRNGALVRLEGGDSSEAVSLCINPVFKEDNSVIFTCQLKKDASANASVQLEVQFPPELPNNETLEVEEESDVVLTCDAHANPQVTVTWLLDGSELDMESGGYVQAQDAMTARLSFYNIQRSIHQGTYSCTTHSPKYGDSTKTFELLVTDKTMKFPLGPIIAGVVVVLLTLLLAFISRWKRIKQCCK
ncbi:transmembrane and immunoglobulin domain-containing protein 1 [Conger conger]|uniref:transmembrane and immunoglobulin domain-containing protein 1 n=1 Tax=Conger conger TaxID=82655 RepID=UPI002A5AFB36|nr:transmembrane and immunoglobulin domain-containing protein 1 [Conger conger]